MATVVECPACQRKLRVPEELIGKKVKCPGCGKQFDAIGSDQSARAPGVEAVHEDVSSERVQAAPVPSQGKPPRDIDKDEAEFYDEPMPMRRDLPAHRGTMILVFGIISLVSLLACLVCSLSSIVGLGLGIPAWAMGQRDLRRMQRNQMDPSGRGLTQAGWICGMIGTILNSIGLLLTIALIVLYGSLFFFAATSSATKPSAPAPVKRKVSINDRPLLRLQSRNELFRDASEERGF